MQFKVRAKYWPCLGFETMKARDLTRVTGSVSGEAVIKNLNSHDCFNNGNDDNLAMNYADLEHFSSSSNSEFHDEDQTLGKSL
jgi:hypothetical protein